MDDRQGVRQSGRPGPLMRYPRQSPVAAALCVNSHNLPGRDVLSLRSSFPRPAPTASGAIVPGPPWPPDQLARRTGARTISDTALQCSPIRHQTVRSAAPCRRRPLRAWLCALSTGRTRRSPLVGHRPERSPFQKTQIVCEGVLGRVGRASLG